MYHIVIGALLAVSVEKCASLERIVEGDDFYYALSTKGANAFRVRVMSSSEAKAIDNSPMIAPASEDAAWKNVTHPDYGQGIFSDSIGGIYVSNTLSLVDTDGNLLTQSFKDEECEYAVGRDASICDRSQDPLTVSSLEECCAACGDGCEDWIFATDDSEPNCWTCSSSGEPIWSSDRILGGSIMRSRTLRLKTKDATSFFGRGGGMGDDGLRATPGLSYQAGVHNTLVYAPFYWSAADKYAALGVVDTTVTSAASGSTNKLGIAFAVENATTRQSNVQWQFLQEDDSVVSLMELYFMPTSIGYDDATRSYIDLIGKPAVPPLYAMGFFASRWGWTNTSYARDVVSEFRSGKYPLDAIIMDFEWFTNISDYAFTSKGESWYNDFSYENDTWVSADAPSEIQDFRTTYQIRFGGIRKPRLGNTELLEYARSQSNWILPGGEELYADGRNLNFANESLRNWYVDQQQHFIDENVSFFWNDEGETDYYTFHNWALAQIQNLQNTNHRYFSLNRAWTPGMSRLGSAVWTGDIEATWNDLAQTPGIILSWSFSGMPFVTCDIGGFNGNTTAQLLTAWYFLGTFLPIMRIHSTLDAVPHFPFLWPEPYASGMRNALNIRYALIPYHYSLAHSMHTNGHLLSRPVLAKYPDYPPITTAFLDGDILVAPLLSESGNISLTIPNTTTNWFSFNASTLHAPGSTISVSNISIVASFLAYVPAGTIVILAPPSQSTDDLLQQISSSASLQVQIYDGADAVFTLVEDDGLSTAYLDNTDLRTTLFSFNTSQRTLYLTVEDTTSSSFPLYETFTVQLFQYSTSTYSNSTVITKGPYPFLDGTSITFDSLI